MSRFSKKEILFISLFSVFAVSGLILNFTKNTILKYSCGVIWFISFIWLFVWATIKLMKHLNKQHKKELARLNVQFAHPKEWGELMDRANLERQSLKAKEEEFYQKYMVVKNEG